eukprot:NODE_144_length_15804_cov_0.729131.p1 type:complete len:886 gc:universal NODE_144_length_15804_cov_0.729131:11250-13907(+)
MESVIFIGLVLRSIDVLGRTLVSVQALKKSNQNMEEANSLHQRLSSITFMLEQIKGLKTSYITNEALNELIDVLVKVDVFLGELHEKNIILKAIQYQNYVEHLEKYNNELDRMILKLNACHVIELKQGTEDMKAKLDQILLQLQNNSARPINDSTGYTILKEIGEIKGMLSSLDRVNMKDLTKMKNELIVQTKSISIKYLNDVVVDTNSVCGCGSFGVVYLGKYGDLNVAVKKFNNMPFEDPKKSQVQSDSVELSKMVLRELRAFEKLQQCPFVVRFYGAISLQGHLAIVTEFLENHSLSHWLYIDEETNIDDKLLGISIGVAKGLEYLHNNGIAHNDVKSSNIMLDMLWEPRLIDFGMVQINNMSTISNNTAIHTGTSQWRAPEYWLVTSEARKQRKDFMFAGDTYSFGVVLGELYTKELPWHEIGKEEMKEAVLSGERPYEFESPLYDVMKSCWAQNPENRADMGSIVSGLEQLPKSVFSTIIKKEVNDDNDSGFEASQNSVDLNPNDLAIVGITETANTFIGKYKGTKVIIKKFIVPIKEEVLKYQCPHPNLAKVIGKLYQQLVFEFVPNGALSYWLYNQSDYLFNNDEKLIILKNVASALKFLHEKELYHGTLHPDNIMFDYEFNVKLTDYCMTFMSKQTIAPNYVSLEYLETQNVAAYDVYAFALLCGEIYTNCPPYDGLNEIQIRSKMGLHAKPYVGGHVPAEISNIVDDGLSYKTKLTILQISDQITDLVNGLYHDPKGNISEDALADKKESVTQIERALKSSSLKDPNNEIEHTYKSAIKSRKNYNEAVKRFTESAEAGNVEAMFALATLYKYGGYMKFPDKRKARIWYDKAAQHEHVEAMYQLSKMTDFLPEKVELLKKCAHYDHKKGIKKLKQLQ